jgi:hypothetical protein
MAVRDLHPRRLQPLCVRDFLVPERVVSALITIAGGRFDRSSARNGDASGTDRAAGSGM